jgi:hypothetical protein
MDKWTVPSSILICALVTAAGHLSLKVEPDAGTMCIAQSGEEVRSSQSYATLKFRQNGPNIKGDINGVNASSYSITKVCKVALHRLLWIQTRVTTIIVATHP